MTLLDKVLAISMVETVFRFVNTGIVEATLDWSWRGQKLLQNCKENHA